MKFKQFATSIVLAIAVLSGCTKSSPDQRDQFVGNYTGTIRMYQNGALVSVSSVTDYHITKSVNDGTQIVISSISSGNPDAYGIVNGNMFSLSGYTVTKNGVTITIGETGTINGNTLTETGTIIAKNLATNLTIYYTFDATYQK